MTNRFELACRQAFWLVFGKRPRQTQRECCWSVTGEPHVSGCLAKPKDA